MPPQLRADPVENHFRQMFNPLNNWFAFLFLGAAVRIGFSFIFDLHHGLDVERDRLQARRDTEDTVPWKTSSEKSCTDYSY